MIRLAAKPVSEKIRTQIQDRVTRFKNMTGRSPQLVVVLVGDDPASVIYTSNKGKAAEKLGFLHQTLKFNATTPPDEVHRVLNALNTDDTVDGILIQRPLPPSFNESEVLTWIAPEKDVDGFHPENVGALSLGLPGLFSCTPLGMMEILKHYEIPIEGKVAVVIGRSSIVGKPIASLLLQAHATVIQCHSRTQNLKELTRQGDLLIAAAGKPHLVDQSLVKPGATVLDVGIHRDADGKIFGDVNYESASQVAGAISPVPGGVGPMTITMLLSNTILAAERRTPS